MKLDPSAQKPLVIFGGIFLLGGLGTAGYLIAKNYKKNQAVKDAKAFQKATVGTINLIETARQIGYDMGVNRWSIDPRSWTENDNAIRDSVLKVPKNLIPQLSLEYAKLYSRDLQADLQAHLDDYSKVRYLFI